MTGSAVHILWVRPGRPSGDALSDFLGESSPTTIRMSRADDLPGALEQIRAQEFALVLLDLTAPGSEGLETFLAARLAAPEVPIVVLAPADNEDLAQRTVREGAFDYLLEHECCGRAISRIIRHALAQAQSARLHEASERRFRALFDQTFQFIGLLAPDGTLLEANQTALDFAGVSLEEVVGRPFWETQWWTVSPEVQQRLKEAVREAAQGRLVRYEVVHRGAGERTAIIDFSLKPLSDEHGKVILLIPEGRDITERKRAETALAEQSALLRQQAELIELAHDAIIVRGLDGVIRFWNQGAEQTYGFSEAEAQDQVMGSLLRTSYPVPVVDVDAALLAQGCWEGELGHVRCDGACITVASRQALQRDQDGNPLAVLEINRDITRRQRAEEERNQLLVRERQKSDQLALAVREAHHRIKNNLQAISDLLYLALTSGEATSPATVLHDSIGRVQAIALVHDLLSYQADVQTVNIGTVLERLVPIVLRSNGLDPHEHLVELQVPSLLVSSKKATTLALIVNELVSNVAKHALRGRHTGRLVLSLRQQAEDLLLSVSDNGPGLPPNFDLEQDAHVGLEVVRVMAERDLGGSLTLVNDGGARAEVRFVW